MCNQYIKNETWYNVTICTKLRGVIFDEFYVNARQDRNELIYKIYAHSKWNDYCSDSISSIFGRPFTNKYISNYLKVLGKQTKIIESCFKMAENE